MDSIKEQVIGVDQIRFYTVKKLYCCIPKNKPNYNFCFTKHLQYMQLEFPEKNGTFSHKGFRFMHNKHLNNIR